MLSTGQVLNGSYQITKVIGKGGMSTVYQAKDLNSGSLLAIKDVARSAEGAEVSVEQTLVTEGRMLMQLSNSHLPRIYDIIENTDSFMLVMDFIEGESLDRLIAREGAQPVERVLDWGIQICEVFDYLHNQKPQPIIYRDMKPANVMLQPDGQLKMIDFGTARTQKAGVAMAADTICLGTAGFAAPEQFGGIGQSTSRTDIFCLGATLYNLVTGHSPSENPKGILPLEKWNPTLKDSPISYIIYKCTRNDPDTRYQSARELAADLLKARQGQFGDPSTWGNSGKLTGNLGRDFQKLNVKVQGGPSGGLSGLLNLGKNNASSESPKKVRGSQWQTAGLTSAVAYQNPSGAVQDYPAVAEASAQSDDSVWHKLTKIGLIIAVLMVLLGVLLIAMMQLVAGLVFIIIALGAAVLAVVGVINSRRT